MADGRQGYPLRKLLAEAKRRHEIRAAIESAYEPVPGDPRFCVRRLEVVEHVARTLGRAMVNNALFVAVERSARALGMEPIRNGGRRLYRCARRRGRSEAEAIADSQANRLDRRPERGRALRAADASRLR